MRILGKFERASDGWMQSITFYYGIEISNNKCICVREFRLCTRNNLKDTVTNKV